MKTIKIEPRFLFAISASRQVHATLAEDATIHGQFCMKGESVTTSPVKLIDFERKYLLTQNTTYFWE